MLRKKEAAEKADFESAMPNTAFQKAKDDYYASMGTPVVDRARLFVLCCVMGVGNLVLGGVLWSLVPLKSTEPWVITVDGTKGTVSSRNEGAQRAMEYVPERPVIERELFQFVERLYTINADYPRGVQQGHVAAYAYAKGRAAIEFREFMDKEQPYQRQKTTKGLVRTIEKKTITFQEDGKLALIRFRTLERSEDRPTAIARDYLMNLQFTREQPTTPEALDLNPLGVLVTHFEIVEER